MELVPVFLKVTMWGALLVLTTTLPKFTELGETVVCATAKLVDNSQKIAINETRTEFLNFRKRFIPQLDITLPSFFLTVWLNG